jgi:hypothetical protein
MEYNAKLVPEPFGLANGGSTCYMASVLQALASCPAFTSAVQDNRAYFQRTETGRALAKYVKEYAAGRPDASAPASVLAALVADLAASKQRPVRPAGWPTARDNVRGGGEFGRGQESASEALAHLVDLTSAGDGANPLTQVFASRYVCDVFCQRCARVVSTTRDVGIEIGVRDPPKGAAFDFTAAVRSQVTPVEGYVCERCGVAGEAFRRYSLTMIPPVAVCAFNAHPEYGGAKISRAFPPAFELPAIGGGAMVYRLVCQIEHSGSSAGGHYWVRALRAGGVFRLNDSNFSPAAFSPSPETCTVVYHRDHTAVRLV